MVSYVFFVAVLNVCLGFAIAVHLGRRHPRLTSLPAGQARETFPAGGLTAWPRRLTETDAATTAAPGAVADRPPVAPAASAGEDRPDESPLSAEVALPPQPSTEAQSLSSFQNGVNRYEEQVSQANDALRCHTGVADAAAIEACLGSLMDATHEYLQHREQLKKGFARPPEHEPGLRAVHASVEAAIDRQHAQIQNCTDSIAKFNEHDDPEAGRMQVVGETSKLIDANHCLRDTLDVALMEVGREQRHLHLAEQTGQEDPLTGMATRAEVEAQLCQWWQADLQRLRQLSLALIDIDHFAEMNQHFGHKLGDELLRAIGQLLAAERRGEDTAARFAGQCFVLLFPDADVRFASNAVERIRQIIDLARFCYRDDELRLTVSCAVTAATAEDTVQTLLARADATLREAKRYGRNRTFLHEGKYPTPVVPPNFSLETREIIL